MLDWLEWVDSIPNLGVLGVPGVPGVLPQKSAIPDANQGVPVGVPGVPQEHLQNGGNPQKSAKPHSKHVAHGISEQQAKALLRDWHGHLSRLDVYEIPATIERMRWGTLVHDSWHVYQTYCYRLVREGWSALDLFGVFPNLPGAGGLADQLCGVRRVLFDGNRAVWSRFGVKSHVCRGACEGHERNGMALIWELNR